MKPAMPTPGATSPHFPSLLPRDDDPPPQTPATLSESSIAATATATPAPDSGSLWASDRDPGARARTAAGICAGFAVVLVVFLAVVLYQRRRGRRVRRGRDRGRAQG